MLAEQLPMHRTSSIAAAGSFAELLGSLQALCVTNAPGISRLISTITPRVMARVDVLIALFPLTAEAGSIFLSSVTVRRNSSFYTGSSCRLKIAVSTGDHCLTSTV